MRLLLVPDAVHIDFYDNLAGEIPYDEIVGFFNEYLSQVSSGYAVAGCNDRATARRLGGS